MTLKLFRAAWFLSVLVVLANLLYVYASLPGEVIVREPDRLTLNRESLQHEGQDTDMGRLMSRLLEFQTTHREKIERDFPKHWRRATGYSLEEFLKPDLNPARL